MNVLNVVLSVLVTGIISYFSILNISNSKGNKKIFIVYMSVFLPLLIIACLFFTGIPKLILNIIFVIMSLYLSIFKKDISNSVYYALIYEFLVFISEILISVIFVSVFKINLSGYENFQFSLLIFSIFNSLATFILSKIKIVCIQIQKFNSFTLKHNYEWIYIIIIMTLISFFIVFNKNNLGSDVDYYINVGMVVFVILSFVYVIYNKLQKSAYENKYNEVMEYVTRYEKIINEQGKKNHEYNNQLMVLKGYLDKPDRLKDYLELIIGEHKTGQNYTVKQLGFLPDGGIKGLLYHKLSKMEEEGIKSYLYVDQGMQELSEDIFDIKTCQDITKILGVFIYNAIDASSKAEQKEIEIDFKVQKDCLIISVANTYDNKTDVNKIGKKGYSTKGAGHGFGLSIVKDISKNNPNIESFSDISDNKFKQTVLIYYKK